MNDTTNKPGVAPARLWLPEDFKGTPYKTRTELFETMEIGDEVRMRAVTVNQRASIRRSAYGFARSKHRKFRAIRENSQVIRVLRER